MKTIIVIGALLLLISPACENKQPPQPKISQKELYELQEKCRIRGEQFVNEVGSTYSKDMNFQVHYNTKLNRCFVAYVSVMSLTLSTVSSVEKFYTLMDVNEDTVVDSVAAYFDFTSLPKDSPAQAIIDKRNKEGQQKIDSFLARINPYMTE